MTGTAATLSYRDFKGWVRGLSWNELLAALEFTIVLEEPPSGNGNGLVHDEGETEDRLLLSMVREQAPKPRPIHPRAVPIISRQLASSSPSPSSSTWGGLGAWDEDGQCSVERFARDRLRRPRFFRWDDATHEDDDNDNGPYRSSSISVSNWHRPRHSRQKQAHQRPRGRFVSSLSAKLKSQGQQQEILAASRACYQLLARTPVVNGERVDVACTEEQRAADESVLLCTSFIEDPSSSSSSPTRLDHRLRRHRHLGVRFDLPQQHLSDAVEPQDILRILRVASRGRFLSEKRDHPHQASAVPGSWLDPTDRWFTLPMYLSCRYERALWDSFHFAVSLREKDRGYKNGAAVLGRTSADRWAIPPESLPPPLVLESMIRGAMTQAAGTLLRKDLEEVARSQKEPAPSSSDSSSLPASCVHSFPSRLGLEFLLEQPKTSRFLMSGLFWPSRAGGGQENVGRASLSSLMMLDRLLSCDLLLLGTPVDELRRDACRCLQYRLAAYCQERLLEQESFLLLPPSASSAPKPNKQAARSKKKKRGKKRGNVSNDSLKDQSPNRGSGGEGASPPADDEDHPDGDEDPGNVDDLELRFPENATPERDRNRNTVLCLSVIQEVLNVVFETVGLEPDAEGFSSQEDDGDAAGALAQDLCSPDSVSPHKSGSDEGTDSDSAGLITIPSPDAPMSSGARSSLSVVNECLDDSSDEEETNVEPDRNPNSSCDEGADAHQVHVPDAHPPIDLSSESRLRNALVLESFGARYETVGGAFYHRHESGVVWEMNDDDWGRVQGLQPREQSMLAEFFATGGVGAVNRDLLDARQESHVASSTAASVDSRSKQGEDEDADFGVNVNETFNQESAHAALSDSMGQVSEVEILEELPPPRSPVDDGDDKYDSRSPSPQAPATPSPTLSPILVSLADLKTIHQDSLRLKQSSPEVLEIHPMRSFLSTPASSLPNSPRSKSLATTLSREDLRPGESKKSSIRMPSPSGAFILANRQPSPTGKSKSRDDQDIVMRRPHLLRKSTDALASYRNSSKPSKAKDDHDIKHHIYLRSIDPSLSLRSRHLGSRSAFSPATQPTLEISPLLPSVNVAPFAVAQHLSQQCARSEIFIDAQDYSNPHHTSLRSASNDEVDNNTVTKDGSTTITSLSHRETEELAALKEERNVYRDLCLTLGAEVAKLKNLLAAQRGTSSSRGHSYSFGLSRAYPDSAFFGPETMSNPFSLVSKARTMAAMSDAGYKGDHESLASEDDLGALPLNLDGSRQVFGSDVSIDQTNSHGRLHLPQAFPQQRDLNSMPFHGTQSRLAREVFLFVESVDCQLRKQEPKRRLAIERMTRLVNTLWPRAQVKLYGSQVSGLCLPSSDLDFVIRLPEVHKKAIAVAPGALEGRNAINETCQKLLARKLKGESWIDPRSMKLIDRTVVPVIKVSTKDTKAKTIQLDITFDAHGHHGMDAIQIVAQIVEELPMIRPLVLVLKQFLLERGLLTAYTGGLSSYCLFLMVARYLQEQASAYGDGGSLLLGFLDFYGNYFDPRSTGISVRRREYFARPSSGAARIQPTLQANRSSPIWNHPSPHYVNPGPAAPYGLTTNLHRRNSFNDQAMMAHETTPGVPVGQTSRPPRIKQATSPRLQQSFSGSLQHAAPLVTPPLPTPQQLPDPTFQDHRIPYTFDPLWVEDPLSQTNNVGRNAFRFLQVQRAFSDAHRALVAALEWDMQSSAGELIHEGAGSSGEYYPLLKSLLQSEDVVFDL